MNLKSDVGDLLVLLCFMMAFGCCFLVCFIFKSFYWYSVTVGWILGYSWFLLLLNIGYTLVTLLLITQLLTSKLLSLNPTLKPHGNGGPGNEQRRFHGTHQKCSLGLNNNTTPCSTAGCSVCSIIKTGWKVSKAGSNAGARFGFGSYFSSVSSKSHDFNSGSEKGLGSQTRSMFVAKVTAGNTTVITNSYNGNSAPAGYQSVIATPGKTQNCNFDELVTFSDDSALPRYLVIYKYT